MGLFAEKQVNISNSYLPKQPDQKSVRIGGIIILALVVAFVVYGVYYFQFKPVITMRLPNHAPLAIDTPPLELTSFQIRAGGEDLVPCAIAIKKDSIYIGFVGKTLIQIYTSDLKLAKSISLEKPGSVIPLSLIVTDSQIVVADTSKGLIGVYDHEGYYLNSVAWYPGRKIRIKPTQLSTDGKLLSVTDAATQQIALISLLEKPPYYAFLELLDVMPINDRTHLRSPSCAILAADGNVWIGDNLMGKGEIFTNSGEFVADLEQPARAKISFPIGFAQALYLDGELRQHGESGRPSGNQVRVHMLDKISGKIFVYDLEGKLKLVYPQERELQEPTSIAANSDHRQIFVTENGNRSITVFGY